MNKSSHKRDLVLSRIQDDDSVVPFRSFRILKIAQIKRTQNWVDLWASKLIARNGIKKSSPLIYVWMKITKSGSARISDKNYKWHIFNKCKYFKYCLDRTSPSIIRKKESQTEKKSKRVRVRNVREFKQLKLLFEKDLLLLKRQSRLALFLASTWVQQITTYISFGPLVSVSEAHSSIHMLSTSTNILYETSENPFMIYKFSLSFTQSLLRFIRSHQDRPRNLACILTLKFIWNSICFIILFVVLLHFFLVFL